MDVRFLFFWLKERMVSLETGAIQVKFDGGAGRISIGPI